MAVRTLAETLIREGQDAQPNARGNTVYRMFLSSERYVVDFAVDFAADGWAQFDTDQDAAYFGTWVNWRRRLVLTYCEGDWSLVVCPTDAKYRQEVRSMIAFYGEGRVALTIDADGTVTEWRQDRATFVAEREG